ncbi:GTP pyrophosphokinase [bacterium (candidate division B38) B3_B38]|nr:MAG: GTP pyrophosphokinase [bacterium (candidate division B38) B3_B38]
MVRFEDIVEEILRYNPEADIDLLRRAYIFSGKEHRGQVRLSGEPYLSHPLAVAKILAETRLDVISVAVGLLHDVIEDTLTTREEVESYFGADITNIVAGVTKISKIPFTSQEEIQAENLRKMILAMVDDIRVILVKIADRLHNMRTLHFHMPKQQERIARETLDIYVPLVYRLGMGKIKSELEYLAFCHLYPESYQSLKNKIEKERKVSQSFIKKITRILETNMRKNKIFAKVEGRVKHLYSIYQKMLRQKISLDEVYDYIAFRVITNYNVADCYAALGIIHNLWSPIPERFKDYIAMPKPNKYQSLHTSVISKDGNVFEIQIRTKEMHKISEEGIAAHWKYKEKKSTPTAEDQEFLWLRQMVEWQQEVKDPREFMHSLKVDLYQDEVYTFTPKGMVKSFPRGATVIDFAYSIHTELGHQCVGARINGKLIPLKTTLKNGDIVEIITSPGHGPSRDWLTFVQTSRARSKIKQWLNRKERERSIELGKKLLEKELKRYHHSLKKLLSKGEIREVASQLGHPQENDLFSALGFGNLSPRQVLSRLLPPEELEKKEAPKPLHPPLIRRRLVEKKVRVKGHDDLLTYFARCCNPIPGESIVGYITRNRGISIHSADCPNLMNLLYDTARVIEVEWELDKDYSCPVEVSIYLEDRPGMLAKITSAIATLKTNIKNITQKELEGKKALVHLLLEVKDINHLRKIVSSLRSIKGVIEVKRVLRQTLAAS